MQARRGALEVRQWDRLHVDPDRFHGFADLSQSVGVGAEPLAHREDVVVHPKEIATFGGCIALQAGEDRDADRSQGLCHGGLFPTPEFLPHPEDERPAVRDDRGIMHED